MSAKPRSIDGYNDETTTLTERVLVTLLRHVGPTAQSMFLVGGLVPRYLVTARPPAVPRHAGTNDVDILVQLEILVEAEAYVTIEANLARLEFSPTKNDQGELSKWRWKRLVGNELVILEFLADASETTGKRVIELPVPGKVSAANIPNSRIVFDHHATTEVEAELLDGEGWASVKVRHADIVSYPALKAFAFENRTEPKDAHDLVYCLEHSDLATAAAAMRAALVGPHRVILEEALAVLTRDFCDDTKRPGHLKAGPVAAAAFEERPDPFEDPETRERRILRQREIATLVSAYVKATRSQ